MLEHDQARERSRIAYHVRAPTVTERTGSLRTERTAPTSERRRRSARSARARGRQVENLRPSIASGGTGVQVSMSWRSAERHHAARASPSIPGPSGIERLSGPSTCPTCASQGFCEGDVRPKSGKGPPAGAARPIPNEGCRSRVDPAELLRELGETIVRATRQGARTAASGEDLANGPAVRESQGSSRPQPA